MQVVVVDQSYEKFYPLSQSRPLWDLFYGMCHASERIEFIFKDVQRETLSYHVRPELEELCLEAYPDKKIITSVSSKKTLFVSPFLKSLEGIDFNRSNCTYFSDGLFVAALCDEKNAGEYTGHEDFFKSTVFEKLELSQELPEFIWNVMSRNGIGIEEDYRLFQTLPSVPEGVAVVGDASIVTVEDGVRIDPFVVIDSTKGPVYISKGCEINPFTRIEGPCYMGENCLMLGAKVREGCSFGTGCRIGGEVEDAIFFPFANKYHDGFIGHAVIGSWVNLGALATNSDLKNDYSSVVLHNAYGTFDTGERKIGSFIGDHSKCSIGTVMNTGTVIGSFSMTVHSGRMVREHLPSFSLYIKNAARELAVESVIKTAETVMSRRNMLMGEAYKKYMRTLCADGAKARYLEHEVINLRENR